MIYNRPAICWIWSKNKENTVNATSVAVLIPTKNRKALLGRALKNVFSQNVEPEEVMVVNDGSNDGTKEFLEELTLSHRNLRVINRSNTGGVNAARNEGIRAIKSEWIAWLDDDDELLPGAISTIKKNLLKMPENYNVAYFNSITDDGNHKYVGGFRFREGEEFYDPSYEDTMTKFNRRGDCTPVFRTSLFDNKKYFFPEKVNGFESYIMSLIARDGKGIRYFKDQAILVHRDNSVEHLSLIAAEKNPWPFFVLNFKQLFEHWHYYIYHPKELINKKITIFKLLLKVIF